MATIELYKSKINKISDTLDDFRSEIDSYNFDLKELSSKLLAVNSSALDKAISDISTASKIQEEQLNSLNDMQTKIDEFVETAQRIDNNVADYVRGLRKFDVPCYGYIIKRPIVHLATVAEYMLLANRFKDCSDIYMISEYVEHDHEKNSYRIKDEQKLNELLTKESPSDIDLMKMRQLFALTVDDDGNIDTEFLKQLIKCSYKEQRHYSEGEIIDRYNKSVIPYEYYTTYTRSKNISSIYEGLSDEKYRELNLIISNLNEEIEGEHLNGEVLYKIKRLEYGEFKKYDSLDYIVYIEDKFAYIEQENENYIFGFDVNIETSDLLNSNCEKRIKKYDITYSTSIKDKNKKKNDTIYKEDYPSYTVYQYADNDSSIAIINRDIISVADININDNIIKAFNSFRQDEKMRYQLGNYFIDLGLEGVKEIAADKLEKAVKANGYLKTTFFGLKVSIGEIIKAQNAAEEAKEKQEFNLRLQDKTLELIKERYDLLITEKLINEARLRGYNVNYVISKDSSGRITDITFANLTINDYMFADAYQRYQNHCVKLGKIRPNDGISHFDELTPELQEDMIYWYSYLQ